MCQTLDFQRQLYITKTTLNLSLIDFHLRITLLKFLIKFGLSEKPTKFEKICLMVLTNQLIYLVNVKTIRQIFSNYVCFSKSPNFNCKFYHSSNEVLIFPDLLTNIKKMPDSNGNPIT